MDSSIVSMVTEIREEAPGIGAYKLHLILRSIFKDSMIGRDKFYNLISRFGLMLTPERKRHTTNSNHNYRKYKNLIKEFKPTAPNRLWVADITYIDTDEGVCYLHLLTDAFTHELLGWVLSTSLKAIHTLNSLEQAIEKAQGEDLKGLIHHSDRGSQYCCNIYVDRLKEKNIQISMTEDYKPTDNAIAERMNGIIKQEWLYRMKRPETIDHAREIIAGIVEFYNNRRPHMSNNMLTPLEKKRNYDAKNSLEALRLQP